MQKSYHEVNNFMIWLQVTNSETGQWAIYLLVCVHTRKALINHHGCVGALVRWSEGEEASVGNEDALQSSLYDRERSRGV